MSHALLQSKHAIHTKKYNVRNTSGKKTQKGALCLDLGPIRKISHYVDANIPESGKNLKAC